MVRRSRPHAGYADRTRSRQEGRPAACPPGGWPRGAAQAAVAAAGLGVLRQAAALLGRDGSRRRGTLPGERDRQARPRGAADAGLLRPAPREADQARARRGGRDRRGRVGPRARRVKARRGRLAEGGAVAATGLAQMAERLALVAEPEGPSRAGGTRPVLALPVEPLRMVDDKVRAPEPQRLAWQRTREVSQRLVTLPAVGPITATARVATSATRPSHRRPALFRLARAHAPSAFDRRPGMAGRDQQAWRGPSPPALASRAGAHARPEGRPAAHQGWVDARLARRPGHGVTLALASRTARLAGAVPARGQPFHAATAAGSVARPARVNPQRDGSHRSDRDRQQPAAGGPEPWSLTACRSRAFPKARAAFRPPREAGSMTAADHRPITLRNALASREPSIHALRPRSGVPV